MPTKDLILKRNKATYQYLYSNFADSLYTRILRIVRDVDACECALKVTFERIWVDIESFDTKRSCLYTWVNNIALKAANEYACSNIITENSKYHLIQLAYNKGLSISNIAAYLNTSNAEVLLSLRQAMLSLRREINRQK